MHPLPLSILAGGQSRRFGRDKARAELAGQPLIQRLAYQVQPVAASVTAVADRPGKYDDLGLSTITDHVPGQGPLGGLATALTHRKDHAGPGWLALLSCDLVEVRPAWIEALAAGRTAAPAAAFRGQRWEPLLAFYHTDLLPRVEAHLAAGRRALWPLLEKIDAAPVPLPDDWPDLSQVNTPEDHERARRQTEGFS